MKMSHFFKKIVFVSGMLALYSVGLYGAAKADLQLVKTASSGMVNQSSAMSYTLTVTNLSGSTDASGLTVTDTLPSGMTYTSGSGTDWTCSSAGTPVTVTCTKADLIKSTSSVLTLNVVSPTSAVSGLVTFSNTATVATSGTDDIVPGNNSGSVNVILNRPPVAANDDVSTASHTAVSGNVLTNDTDLDGDTLSVTNTGTFTLSYGSFTYTPGYFTGETDHYIYTVSDGHTTTTATLQINIGSACTDTGNNNTDRNFCLRKQTVLFGDMVTIGNTVIVPPDPQPESGTDKVGYCSTTYTTGDFSTDTNNIDNQGLYLCSYRPDTNLNATSAELITTGKIKWAGLYLQGVVKSDDAASLSSMDVKIKKDGSSYVSAGAPTVINHKSYVTTNNSTDYDNYSAFIDVTQAITSQNWQGGVYTVANVPVTTDALVGGTQVIGKYGAWTLVVIYEDTALPLKSVSVYDGWKKITGTNSSSSATINVGNFYTPTTGTIDSTVSIFVGEGDKYRHGDHFYGWVPGGSIAGKYLGTQDNAFDSGIVSTGTRTPSLSNNQGIDIKTYQIGSGADQLLSNSDNNISFKFSTDGDIDYHYPSMLAFSTEVYHPRMCYYEDLYHNGVKLATGDQVAKGSAIQAKVLLKNDMNEPAEKVMLYRTFESTMPYTLESTGYKLNPTGLTDADKMLDTTSHVTDAYSAADNFDYSTPLSLFSLHAGTGATYNQGGDFTNNQTALFDYNTTANFDGNKSITYQIAYTMPTIGFRYEGELAKCVDFNNTFGVIPASTSVPGNFNVVYADEANATLSSGYYYNLPTQITSRADNYKVISLESGTDILKDVNATVAVEVVDADSSIDCAARTPVSNNKIWVHFNNTHVTNFSAADIINNILLLDSDAATKFYQKAVKNAVFRVSYPTTDDGGLIEVVEDSPGLFHLKFFPAYAGNSCVSPVTATVYNNDGTPKPQPKTYTQVPEACANAGASNASAMTQHELDVCFECIYGAHIANVCSRDNFAIRPEAFVVKVNDQNQTDSVFRQTIANNMPATVTLDLASGYRYYAEVNATNHLNNTPPIGYTTSETLDSIWEPRTGTPTGCNDDANKTSPVNFANGVADANMSVDQVGEYRLNMTDATWASVDSNVTLMSHHTSPYFKTAAGSDCNISSSVTSAVKTTNIGVSPVLNGCNISSNHVNSVAGITYSDFNVTFHPYKFDMASIGFGLGTVPNPITANQNGFVYTSDMSRNDSMNMSVRATGSIRAVGYDDVNMSNFVTNCYAKNLNLSLKSDNNLTLTNTNYQVRFMDFNSSGGLIYDSNATNVNTSSLIMPLIQINESNCTKDTAGTLPIITRLNYDRNVTLPTDPRIGEYSELDVQCTTAAECTMQADLSALHQAVGNRAMDFNVTHAYGRIIPRDVRVFGTAVDVIASAWYEVYNASTLAATALPPSRNTPLWYINTQHIDLEYGDGIVTQLQTAGAGSAALVPPISGASVLGVETYNFGPYAIGSYKAHIDTDPWLWYGVNALDYVDPVTGDTEIACLTHPCFNINVVPDIGRAGSSTGVDLRSDKANKGTRPSGIIYDYTPATR